MSRRPQGNVAVLLLLPVLTITAAMTSGESQSFGVEEGGSQLEAAAGEHSAEPARPAPPRPPEPHESSPVALEKQVQDVPLIEITPRKTEEKPKQPQPAVPDRSPAEDSKPEEGARPRGEKPKGSPPPANEKPETGEDQLKQMPSSAADQPSAPDTEADESPQQPPPEKPEQQAPVGEGKPEDGAPAAKTLKPIAPDEAVGILGKKVHGPAGEDMGMIVDVLVDDGGKPRAAVIDFGGFLGVGSRKIATDWQLLQFRPGDRTQPVLLSLGKEELGAAPEYKLSIYPTEIVAPPPPPPPMALPDAEK